MNQPSRDTQILVTGGTGLVGSYLIRTLLQSGYHRIRALCRETSKFELLNGSEDQVEWIRTDVLDTIGLEEAMQGVQEVYHCAALISFNAQERDLMIRTNRDGTANVVNAALHEGIYKLVHVSSVAAIGRDKRNAWVDEATKWVRSPENTTYAISKFQAEQEVWRGQAEGLRVAVVNPTIILGGGFWDSGSLELFKVVWDEFPFYPSGKNGFVDVRDVTRFMIRLMESEAAGERYILNGVNLSYREFQETTARIMGRRLPRYKLSSFLATWASRLEWIRSKVTGKPPLITRENAKLTSLAYQYKNEKSRSDLDFEYTPLEQTIRETAELLEAAAEENFSPKVLPIHVLPTV